MMRPALCINGITASGTMRFIYLEAAKRGELIWELGFYILI